MFVSFFDFVFWTKYQTYEIFHGCNFKNVLFNDNTFKLIKQEEK
jgi:hypothetical protein